MGHSVFCFNTNQINHEVSDPCHRGGYGGYGRGRYGKREAEAEPEADALFYGGYHGYTAPLAYAGHAYAAPYAYGSLAYAAPYAVGGYSHLWKREAEAEPGYGYGRGGYGGYGRGRYGKREAEAGYGYGRGGYGGYGRG